MKSGIHETLFHILYESFLLFNISYYFKDIKRANKLLYSQFHVDSIFNTYAIGSCYSTTLVSKNYIGKLHVQTLVHSNQIPKAYEGYYIQDHNRFLSPTKISIDSLDGGMQPSRANRHRLWCFNPSLLKYNSNKQTYVSLLVNILILLSIQINMYYSIHVIISLSFVHHGDLCLFHLLLLF